MKRSRSWLALGVLIALAVLFLFVNFHLSINKNYVSRNTVTTGMGGDKPATVQQRDNIMVIVDGKGVLATALEKSLYRQISTIGGVNPVIAKAVEPSNKNPVLLVKIAEKQIIWTPIYGSSNIQVLAGYTSNGELELIQNLPLKSTNVNGAIILMSGDYKLTGNSFGFISLPGYRQMTADAIASSIMEDIKAIYLK